MFPNDYGLEEEDEVDINGEPLFEDELATQATGVKPKRKSRQTKAYTAAEDKLLCIPRFEDIQAHGGKEAVEEVGEGEKPQPRGKTNSKKEYKRDAASIALIATVEGMMSKKDSREEKRRQDKEE
ncbi:Helicase SKI2W [Hordeum vulgare]|nr:Helicase SKI2W [Hordeum vulgare]